ncbi:hypothetical protein MOC17_16155 [Bacillus haynesii]|uniref:hypothetical protein n=1 Tax=Bacillus haynesii TaxID=1925021 RepID=UPI0022815F59|nr:hypothetical protein [Bacillus haynesii]MCY8047602.1 hypothetical protein [Bacillus haynesii]
MKTEITFGDLVAVDGYPDRIFFVDARRKIVEEDDTGVSTYVEFDLTDAIHGDEEYKAKQDEAKAKLKREVER